MSVQRIDAYELPSDDNIMREASGRIICDGYFLSDNCDRSQCVRNSIKFRALQEQMLGIIKNTKERKK